MEKYGLPEETIARITAVLAQFPSIERAILFGSRAKGTAKPGSDIDLALCGPALTEREIVSLAARLDALDLPYTFDLCHFEKLANPQLIAHIERVGKEFYRRNP
ncbi:nucleotidyltransferase domain-containing protein [Hydrogenophilus islandicus]